jgi:hypothetical protein
MHYHCEIIMPPSKNIQETIEKILEPFCEHNEERTGNEFWDYFVIGGRWAGTKQTCQYDAEKIEKFYQDLRDKKITVSGIQMGKQELKPASQIPMVDELWNKYFPTEDGTITACPMFAHSNNQFDSNDLISCDISRFDEIPDGLTASRVIFAAPDYEGKRIEGKFMLCEDQWNGMNHMPISWDGKVKSAIDMYLKSLSNYTDEYREKYTPEESWICVTVDYHS